VEPVRGAEISASAFRLLGTAPLLGRTLTEQDERPGEPPVAVIGHTLWKTRFDSDAGVVGRAVKLGTATATIVGVMPEGFGFPVKERIWTPLRTDGAVLAPRTGPVVSVFGRLAPNASIDESQAELGVIGARMSASNPETHKYLRPRVTTYAKPLAEGGQMLMLRNILYVVNGIFLMLLAIVCANVATLVFGHARLGDHGSNRARRQSWPHHLAAVRRGAGAGRRRGGARVGRRACLVRLRIEPARRR
jgi:hypothetical protein